MAAGDSLITSMRELDEDQVLHDVCELRDAGTDRQSIMQILNDGMQQVGSRFENGDYFLADLIVSGIIYRKALDLLGNDTGETTSGRQGRVVIGVVKNDIHDIGKDIIVSTLRSDGYNVLDIGVDVDSGGFVKAVMEQRPDLVLLCGAMTYTAGEMRKTIQHLEQAGVREYAKIVVGGQGVSERESRDMNADGYSLGPTELLKICRELLADG